MKLISDIEPQKRLGADQSFPSLFAAIFAKNIEVSKKTIYKIKN